MNAELPLNQLKRRVDPHSLGFDTTESFESLEGIVGQKRATDALRFGLTVKGSGFNIYVAGPHGIGKMTSVKSFLQELATERDTPPDWCYVNNYSNPYEPCVIRLPAGRGRELKEEMEDLIEHIKEDLPKVFESEEYSSRREEITQQIQDHREQISKTINEKAAQEAFTLSASPMGVVLLPVKKDGKPLSDDEYNSLSEEQRKAIDEKRASLQEELKAGGKKIRNLQREARQKVKELDQEIVTNILGGLFDDLKERYEEFPDVLEYLEDVRKDILENIATLKVNQQQNKQASPVLPQVIISERQRDHSLRKHQVNVVVDNSEQKGAPVVVELNPTYSNLMGRIEKEMQMGALSTDFTLLKAGALLRANGGFLVLQIEDVLKYTYSWEALKRSLRGAEVRIEELAEQAGLMSIKSLRPEPIPLDVKVVLIGQPVLYHILYTVDHEFPELFKVKADFDIAMDLGEENKEEFIRFVSTFCRKENLKHLDSEAVASILEQASRMAEHKKKLSTKFGYLADLIRESHFWSSRNGSSVIQADDVAKALEQKRYRSNLIQKKIEERIAERTILVDTEGEIVGQVNGLSIIDLGDYMFGKPVRITATVSAGQDGIVDIEREVKLAGPIHSKGVLILSGYLTRKFSQGKPVSLAARLVFEQSYEGIEGDSASSTELYAILSALSGLPLRQSIAVTGSVNQHGTLQPVGGINQKIEGFYDICRVQGLTGKQGVIIPESNAKHLMLHDDVIRAVEKKKFSIWAVSSIDEGIEILTGIPAGERDSRGRYPQESVNGRVMQRLETYEKILKEMNPLHLKGRESKE
jgi:lon-related putative ATP-dependent protease